MHRAGGLRTADGADIAGLSKGISRWCFVKGISYRLLLSFGVQGYEVISSELE